MSGKSKAVRVAIRANGGLVQPQRTSLIDSNSASAVTAITPTAYNLGLSVGWHRFAIAGDVAKVQGGAVPGSREAAELGVSYSLKSFTGKLALGADRADPSQLRISPVDSSYSLDVGGSYRLRSTISM